MYIESEWFLFLMTRTLHTQATSCKISPLKTKTIVKMIPSGYLVYKFPDIFLQSSDLVMLQIKYNTFDTNRKILRSWVNVRLVFV